MEDVAVVKARSVCWRGWGVLVCGMGLLLVADAAMAGATCQKYKHPMQGGAWLTFPDTLGDRYGTVGALTVDAATPDGTVLGQVQLSGLPIQPYYCSQIRHYGDLARYSVPSSIEKVFETEVPGIGLRMRDSSFRDTYVYPYQSEKRFFAFVPSNLSAEWTTSRGMLVEIVKTGAVSSGRVTGGHIGSWRMGVSPATVARFFLDGFDVTAVQPTCNFESGPISVPLGDHQSAGFTGVGSAPGVWTTFALNATGCTNASEVLMTFAGTAAPGNPEVFAVSGGAAGIGVEVKSHDNYKAIPNADKPMWWIARKNAYGYAFKARYIQTAATVTPGPANASMTVNLEYK